jgi:hypothetical protein
MVAGFLGSRKQIEIVQGLRAGIGVAPPNQIGQSAVYESSLASSWVTCSSVTEPRDRRVRFLAAQA